MKIRLALLAVFTLLVGCPCGPPPEPPPKTLAAAQQRITESRDQAKVAWEKRDTKAAQAAAERARRTLKQARVFVKAAQPAPVEKTQDSAPVPAVDPLKESKQLVGAARRFAGLASESDELESQCRGIKAKGYRATRKVTLRILFSGLGLAADQANKGRLNSLPKEVQDSAQLAADLAQNFTGRSSLPNGDPDWAGITKDMKAFSASPPFECSFALATAFLVMGKDDLALYEIQTIDPAKLATPESKWACRIARGMIYRLNGYRHLADLEFGETGAVKCPYGAELQAGLHLLLAGIAVNDKNYERADQEIVRAMKAWPNNPLSVFLTGEQLAVSGDYEKAAASLEEFAKGTEEEWLAEKIAGRARSLRDEKGDSTTLLHDPAFVRRIALHYLWEAAKKSEPAAKLKSWVEGAQAFGGNFLAKFQAEEKKPTEEKKTAEGK